VVEKPARFPRLDGSAMIDKGKAQRLVGETIRDVGILVVVFGPLDAIFQKEGPGEPLIAVMVVFGLLSVTLGIILESLESDE